MTRRLRLFTYAARSTRRAHIVTACRLRANISPRHTIARYLCMPIRRHCAKRVIYAVDARVLMPAATLRFFFFFFLCCRVALHDAAAPTRDVAQNMRRCYSRPPAECTPIRATTLHTYRRHHAALARLASRHATLVPSFSPPRRYAASASIGHTTLQHRYSTRSTLTPIVTHRHFRTSPDQTPSPTYHSSPPLVTLINRYYCLKD